jgi:hypothetical protein
MEIKRDLRAVRADGHVDHRVRALAAELLLGAEGELALLLTRQTRPVVRAHHEEVARVGGAADLLEGADRDPGQVGVGLPVEQVAGGRAGADQHEGEHTEDRQQPRSRRCREPPCTVGPQGPGSPPTSTVRTPGRVEVGAADDQQGDG